MAESKKFVAIVNPVSGRHNVLHVMERVKQRIEQAGARLEIRLTEWPGHATELTTTIDADTHAVLVVGGDGTISEVINGFAGRSIPLVILQTGTENLLARELDMPTDHERVVETLLKGEPYRCDVGMVNGKRFLAVSGAGFDAECVFYMSLIRKGHITRWDYFRPVWRTFWSYPFPVLRVEADGNHLFEGRGFFVVGNIRNYATGIRIFKYAKNDDGLLDLVVFPCASRTGLIIHAIRAFFGRHVDRGGVIYHQCRHIRASSHEVVPIEMDGEVGGFLPAEWSIREESAKFLRLPKRSNGDRVWKSPKKWG